MNNNRLLSSISGNVFVNPASLIGVRVYDTSFIGKHYGTGQILSCSGAVASVYYENVKFQVNPIVVASGYPQQTDGTIRLDNYLPASQDEIFVPESGGLNTHDFRLTRSRVVFSGSINYQLPDVSGVVTSGYLPATQLIIL